MDPQEPQEIVQRSHVPLTTLPQVASCKNLCAIYTMKTRTAIGQRARVAMRVRRRMSAPQARACPGTRAAALDPSLRPELLLGVPGSSVVA